MGIRAFVLVVCLTSCTASLPPPAGGSAGEGGWQKSDAPRPKIPPALAELGLTKAQETTILAMRQELRDKSAPVMDAGRRFAAALASAVKRCDADDRAMRVEAQRAIAVGESFRPVLLDSIMRLHALLTPDQRQKLSRRLLDDDERREENRDDDRGVRALGETIDLSIGQILEILNRSRPVRGELRARFEPMRDQLREAAEAFPRPDFDVRKHAIADARILELVADFVFEAGHVVLPVLERAQCAALGDFLAERFEEKPAAKDRE
jgi:Spy/CpxP family protein refolding chaperone